MQKKVGRRFKRQTKPFFLGWVIYNVQVHLNPRWCLIIDRDVCAAFWKLNKLNKEVFRGYLFENLSNSLYL